MHGRGHSRAGVVTQPAQLPDLNCNDLAFFASLQTDVRWWQRRLCPTWQQYYKTRGHRIQRCVCQLSGEACMPHSKALLKHTVVTPRSPWLRCAQCCLMYAVYIWYLTTVLYVTTLLYHTLYTAARNCRL